MICQVNDDPELECPALENGPWGYRCEVSGPHVRHRIGEHSILHALKGNGYSCEVIEFQVLMGRIEVAIPGGFSD